MIAISNSTQKELVFYLVKAEVEATKEVRPWYGKGSGEDDYEVDCRLEVEANISAHTDGNAREILWNRIQDIEEYRIGKIEDIRFEKYDTYYGEDAEDEELVIDFHYKEVWQEGD